MIVTLITFVLILGLLVFIHELGHFIVAKRCGLTVEEFGLGFPPRLFKYKHGETVYSLNLLPFGGFVKILGEDGEGSDNPKSFASQSAGRRALILLAGVIMNFLLGTLLFIIVYLIGAPAAIDSTTVGTITNRQIQIAAVANDSPAAVAGLREFDQIKSVAGTEITAVEQVQQIMATNAGQATQVVIHRANEDLTVTLTPRVNPPQGEGPLGVDLVESGIVRYPWYNAIWRGVVTSFSLLFLVVVEIGKIFRDFFTTGHVDGNAVSGPIGIAVFTGQVARLGFSYLLQFVAFLSIQLAFLNVVPFPALDGGRLLFVIIEKFRGGKKVAQKVEGIIHFVGFALLLALIVAVSFRDIYHFRAQFIDLWHRIVNVFR